MNDILETVDDLLQRTTGMSDIELRRANNAVKRRILKKLHAIEVLDGLSRKQQVKLANHIFQASLHYALRMQIEPDAQRVKLWFGRSPGQLRTLRRKAEQLRADFEDLRRYAASIGRSGNVYLTSALDDDFQLGRNLAEIATALQKLEVPPDTMFGTVPGPRMSASDPKHPATRVLADFFTGTCHLSMDNATGRIARIENALWRGNIREDDPDSYTPNRSSAIAKRLKRNPTSTRR